MAIVDFHNHLMPAVDDGARSLDEADQGVRALVAQGVGGVITTPHFEASLVQQQAEFGERMGALDEAWETLEAHVRSSFPALDLRRGVELRLDTPEPAVGDGRLRLGGGSFILVEFPLSGVPPHSARVLRRVVEQDAIPVVAHPERYAGIATTFNTLAEWRRAGAYLQVNCGSLTGRYGSPVREIALRILERGWADYLCSDYHSRGVPATEACRLLLQRLGHREQQLLLMETNPELLLRGERPAPVPPLRLRGALWRRIVGLFH